ncbi:hypothetical protein BDR05DRAFT_966475 [Suillus weaverae]|nr:hypothetical protein BDR05DRAFT_966475 [Suillus weaverae]
MFRRLLQLTSLRWRVTRCRVVVRNILWRSTPLQFLQLTTQCSTQPRQSAVRSWITLLARLSAQWQIDLKLTTNDSIKIAGMEGG